MRRRHVVRILVGLGLLAGPHDTAPAAAAGDAALRAAAPGTKLKLQSITPSDGAAVIRQTLVRAQLLYTIPDFEPGAFRIFPQFDTDDEDATSGADTAFACVPAARSGRCEIQFPMMSVWDEPEITRPFKVWFYLTKKNDRKTATVVAWAGPVRYWAR